MLSRARNDSQDPPDTALGGAELAVVGEGTPQSIRTISVI